MKTENSEKDPTIAIATRRQRQHPVAAVTNLDVHLTVLVPAAVVLAAQRPELCGRARRTMGNNCSEVNTGTRDSPLRRNMVEDRALEEAVVRRARGRGFG